MLSCIEDNDGQAWNLASPSVPIRRKLTCVVAPGVDMMLCRSLREDQCVRAVAASRISFDAEPLE